MHLVPAATDEKAHWVKEHHRPCRQLGREGYCGGWIPAPCLPEGLAKVDRKLYQAWLVRTGDRHHNGKRLLHLDELWS